MSGGCWAPSHFVKITVNRYYIIFLLGPVFVGHSRAPQQQENCLHRLHVERLYYLQMFQSFNLLLFASLAAPSPGLQRQRQQRDIAAQNAEIFVLIERGHDYVQGSLLVISGENVTKMH